MILNQKDSERRHPIKNFLIKKDIQVRIILRVIGLVSLVSVITAVVMVAVYYSKSKSGYLYFMSQNILDDLQRQNILMVILPTLFISEIISVAVGIWLSLYSSRKVAVPIYKVEQWAGALRNGDLTARIRFREKESMRSLTDHCNVVTEKLERDFKAIHEIIENMGKTKEPLQISVLKDILSQYRFGRQRGSEPVL